MKIIILILFMSFQASANWVKQSAVKAPSTIWAEKIKCESIEGEACFDITDKDPRRFMVGQVDDLTAPNYRTVETSPVKIDCLDFADCSAKATDPDGDPQTTDRVCISDESNEKWDLKANFPGVTGIVGPWFIWCQKVDGTYQQKDALVADAMGIAQADIDDGVKAATDAAYARLDGRIKCGIELKKSIQLLTNAKNWTKAQRRGFRANWQAALDDLIVGELDDALTDVQAFTPDANITQADLDAAEGLINSCIAKYP